MGLMEILGLANRDAPRGYVMSDEPQTLRLDEIVRGHSRDRGRHLTDDQAREPVEVERIARRRFRLIDGTERCALAGERGDRTIQAYVWARP